VTRRHVILVGLPGSGKTSVGRLVAAELGARFVDVDEAVERRAGKSVARIFAEDGEAAFRTLEAELGAAAFAGAPAVIAPGGGFFAAAVTRAMARGSGLVVYLQTDPAAAAARLQGPNGRPLLAGGDVESRVAALLTRREPLYAEAECTVATGGRTVEQVAAAVASLARDRAGW
jgi:shikimate kinase